MSIGKMELSRFETWPIVAVKSGRRLYGRAISLFINNGSCHLTSVDVFADGSINCWGFVDRQLFQQKLRSRWVVPAPHGTQAISVFDFGMAVVAEGSWSQSPQSIGAEVEGIVRELNPDMTDLVDLQGPATVEARGKLRSYKVSIADRRAYRQVEATHEDIPAEHVPILRRQAGYFELTRLFIYADGLLQVGAAGALFPLDELSSLYERGKIANHAPAGSAILLPGLGEFRTESEFGGICVHDRMGEVHDKLAILHGQPGAVAICRKCFVAYERNPSATAKQALRVAYEAVPRHLRRYCGGMDLRDAPIRAVLYGAANEIGVANESGYQ